MKSYVYMCVVIQLINNFIVKMDNGESSTVLTVSTP